MSRLASPATNTLSSKALPKCLPGFESIRRHWDSQRNVCVAKVAPGEYYVTRSTELITTVLGSCISACVRDRRRNIGGMNHFMLPAGEESKDGLLDSSLRFGNVAMEHLFNALYSRGSRREDLEVKLFGGGQVMTTSVRIGDRNIAFARDFLRIEGYEVKSENVGGYSGRRILYDPLSGKALVKRTHSNDQQAILREEARYLDSLEQKPVAGGLELF